MNVVARRLLSHASAGVDRAVVAAMQMRNRGVRSRAEALPHADRMARLASIATMYGAPELLADGAAFFPRPDGVRPEVRQVTAPDLSVPDQA